ncbi:hypothetical protein Tco_0608424 [Tanacetum coccineum]
MALLGIIVPYLRSEISLGESLSSLRLSIGDCLILSQSLCRFIQLTVYRLTILKDPFFLFISANNEHEALQGEATGAAPGIKSIWNSTWRIEGRPGRSSGKTSGNSLTIVLIQNMSALSLLRWRDKVYSNTGCRFALAVGGLLCLCGSLGNASSIPIVFSCSARTCVMQGASFTQGKVSSIPTVFSWGGSISPDGFLPSDLLLVVIIVAFVIVVVIAVALLPDPLTSGLW